ncbi:MAG: DUF433 domain-containing protein [Gallionella sp.]|nr:DUF433 domain-containing protein [Gallionella sp.]
MKQLNRITADPAVMGGKPCVRGQRITVGMLTGLVASGKSTQQILALYPYLEAEDITQALRYAAWRAEEIELPITAA